MSDNNTKTGTDNPLEIEENIVAMLRTVYDPEIPVNIYDLGLVYDVDVDHETGHVEILMTLTAPNCPMADFILEDTQMKVESVKGVKDARVNITFDPVWNKEMMTDEAKLELGFM